MTTPDGIKILCMSFYVFLARTVYARKPNCRLDVLDEFPLPDDGTVGFADGMGPSVPIQPLSSDDKDTIPSLIRSKDIEGLKVRRRRR